LTGQHILPEMRVEEEGDDDFTHKIDNPSMVTRNLANILFSEEFSDVVLVCGQDRGQGL
jgi:hypothetical protein